MTTSRITREYWVGHAKEWAEIRLTHLDYGATPQLDEFNAVMDELLAESLEAAKLRAAADRAVQVFGYLQFYNGIDEIMSPEQIAEYEAVTDMLLAAMGVIRSGKGGG